jgi:transcriptional regulator with XRE-family HTH domain
MTNNTMPKPFKQIPIGTFFRQKREEKGLLVRQVAAVTELDQAIISRIENNDRLPTKEQVVKLAGLYNLDLKQVMSVWLAERMIRDYGTEPYAPEALREAHSRILTYSLMKPDIENKLLNKLSSRKPPKKSKNDNR